MKKFLKMSLVLLVVSLFALALPGCTDKKGDTGGDTTATGTEEGAKESGDEAKTGDEIPDLGEFEPDTNPNSASGRR